MNFPTVGASFGPFTGFGPLPAPQTTNPWPVTSGPATPLPNAFAPWIGAMPAPQTSSQRIAVKAADAAADAAMCAAIGAAVGSLAGPLVGILGGIAGSALASAFGAEMRGR